MDDQPATPANKEWLLDTAVRVGLILAILAVYAQTVHFDFINFDDPEYVLGNTHVQAGMTPDSIKWAFTAATGANWTPVTLLSHMLVCQFFGLQSGMHHLVNVLIHVLASLLLFAVLHRATGARGASAFVAFIFALHPLHVESVAWIAERKDVLSAFFLFLALYAYVRYAEQPSLRRYLTVLAVFCLGLMSKPMLVTFPFVLLLFDVWPLRRVRFPKILWEKLPFVVLAAGASAVTYLIQGSSGALGLHPLGRRIQNALISYVIYIGQTFWPTRLSINYPYPHSVEAWQPACALAVLLGITAVAIYTWRTRPYIVTGWFWYLGTLVPAIGLVQVGMQSRADRYTYIPMVGLLWILAWGGEDLLKKLPRAKPAFAAAAVASCLACMALSWRQVEYWRNGVTLFHHAAVVTENSEWALYNLGGAYYLMGCNLANSGQGSEAILQFEEALRVRPNYAEAHNNLGIQLASIPMFSSDAISHFEAALRIDPNLIQAHRNLGILLSSVPGREAEALAHSEAALRVRPDPELSGIVNRLRERQGSSAER